MDLRTIRLRATLPAMKFAATGHIKTRIRLLAAFCVFVGFALPVVAPLMFGLSVLLFAIPLVANRLTPSAPAVARRIVVTPTSRSERVANLTMRVTAYAGVVVFFWFIGLTMQYDATRPTVQDPQAGRTYPQSVHGSIVYLTDEEAHRVHLLEAAAGGLFLCAVGLQSWVQRQNRR